MNLVVAQQVALDNALVAPEKRLKIEKCKARIEFIKPQREATYQVTLDIFLILPNQDFVEPPSEDEMVPFIQELGYSSKCDMLSAIHTDQMHLPWRTFKNVNFVALLWEDFMFQADNRDISPARKEHMPYPRFTKVIINHFISKDKTISMRNTINIHNVRDDTLLGTLKFISKTKDYQKYGALIPDEMINQDIKDSKAYKTYLDFATRKATPKKARMFKKFASPSKKLYLVLEEEPTVKPKHAKKPAKKSTTVQTTSVVIRHTPAALLEAAQLKKTLKKSKLETHKLHASGSNEGTSTKPGVPDVPKYQSESENESWGDNDDDSNDDDSDDDSNDDDDDVDSDADGDNEASASEKTDFDEDVSPNLNQNEDEEKEYEEEYVRTPDSYRFTDDDDEEYEELYKDVNVRLKDAEHKEEGKGDAKMTDVGRDDGTQKITYEQIKDDEHVILTAVHNTQNIKVLLQSSYVSSDFASQFLNLDNVPPTDIEVISMMNVKVRHEEPITQTPSLLNIPVTVIPETSSAVVPTIPLKIPPIVTPPKMCRIGNMSGSVTS
ncbi:hypothetical protein Tco_0848985 [Tanacetum coccineum]